MKDNQIKEMTSKMIGMVKGMQPEEGVSALASAFLNVVKGIGTVLGYKKGQLEKIILQQMLEQV